jgi:hypothetical protein
MGKFSLVWDLSSGQARVPLGQDRGLELVIASVHNPLDGDAYRNPTATTGQATIDIWGLDRRMCLVASAFFRRAEWLANFPGYDPLGAYNGTEGEGWACGLAAFAIRRDNQGVTHVLGQINSAIFLNGGTFGNGLGDGCEITDGGDGIRLVVSYSLNPAYATLEELPAWNLCLALELRANVVMGCDGLADHVVALVRATIPSTFDIIYPVGA